MRKNKRAFLSLLLIFLISFSSYTSAFGQSVSKKSRQDVYDAAQKTIKYYNQTYKDKEYKGILDWPALGLFALGEDISGSKWTVNNKNGAYWREQEVRKGIGLSKAKNTDYQRTIIGICSAGKDPRNFGGINLVKTVKDTMLPNGHFADSVADNKTGKPIGEDLVNSHIFGIVALYCAGEPIPNRDKCVEWLEKQQHHDGGFTWDVKYFDDPDDYKYIVSDVDMTAGALTAFAILGEDEFNPVVAKAIKFLHKNQLESGGFNSWGADNPESCAWVIQALTLMNQDPMGEEWTTEAGENPVTSLLKFQKNNGSFVHVLNEGEMLPLYENSMSTEQALYGMADAYNKKSVYNILHNKYRNEAEKYLFSDYKPGDYGFDETIDLVYDYVISGYTDSTFKPQKDITRAELCKLLVNAMGLKRQTKEFKGANKFKDMDSKHWSYKNISICDDKNYVQGINKNEFCPDENITGEQLMAILVRTAGFEKQAEELNEDNKDWSYGYIKIAKQKGLVYENFEPNKPVNRAQCSWSLYQLRNIIK